MSSDVVFRDPLVGALWRARRDATTIAPTDQVELTPERGEERLASAPLVASGSLITPVPLQPGRHQVDFGQLGSLHLEVTA